MIAKVRSHSSAERIREHFLSLLPAINEQARFAFRYEEPERRQELVAEVIANCWTAFVA